MRKPKKPKRNLKTHSGHKRGDKQESNPVLRGATRRHRLSETGIRKERRKLGGGRADDGDHADVFTRQQPQVDRRAETTGGDISGSNGVTKNCSQDNSVNNESNDYNDDVGDDAKRGGSGGDVVNKIDKKR